MIIGNHKKEKTAILYIIDFKSLLASVVGQHLSFDSQVTSGLGGGINIYISN